MQMTYMNRVVEYSSKVKAKVLVHQRELFGVPWPNKSSIMLRVQTHITCELNAIPVLFQAMCYFHRINCRNYSYKRIHIVPIVISHNQHISSNLPQSKTSHLGAPTLAMKMICVIHQRMVPPL